MRLRARSSRLLDALAAAVAVAVLALVLRPSTDAPGAPQLVLTAAGGKSRIENSKEGQPILRSHRLAPGEQGKGRVKITNARGGKVALRLSARRVRDRRTDVRARLSRATEIRVVRRRLDGRGHKLIYTGPLRDLRRVDVGTLRANVTRRFIFRATFAPKRRHANRYRNTTVRFDLVWNAKRKR